MARIGSVYITQEPRNHEIYNSFGLMGNEKFLQDWTSEEGACGCGGTHYATLTDTRLIMRFKAASCCNRCCEPSHTDISIFLRDVSEMREWTGADDCCSLLCAKCFGCCRRATNFIEIRGTFGSEILHIPKMDMAPLQIEISAAIGNHKLVSHY